MKKVRAIHELRQARAALKKALCAIERYRERPDGVLLQIAIDYILAANTLHLQILDGDLSQCLQEEENADG